MTVPHGTKHVGLLSIIEKLKGLLSPYFSMVPEVGLEPTRLAAHDFESRSSANSDTLACSFQAELIIK